MDDNVAPSPPSQPNNMASSMPTIQPFQEPLMTGSGELPPPPRGSQPSSIARSRTSSNATPPPLQQPQQPIKDAVSSAFEHSPTTNQLDPNLIAQITAQVTEQVINSLQNANIGTTSATSAVPPQSQFSRPSNFSNANPPRSPTQSSTAFSEPRFTPPISPLKDRHQSDAFRYASVSPDHEPSDDGGSTYSTQSRQSQASMRSTESRRSEATPRPFKTRSSPPKRTDSRREGGSSGDEKPRRRRDSNRRAERANTSSRRQSRNSEASIPYMDGAAKPTRRSPKVSPQPEDAEETTLERIWQPLFDNGNPTMRLGQFLRGIAIHLIEDYEPKFSHVVTPKKMAQFFSDTKVANELYPWALIFDGGMMNKSISTMYRKLLCQHHLVQVFNQDEPTVPALTPSGFEWFMTCLIQAHPDTEFERLSTTVMNMPISNSDKKTERFPKELSRRLLPSQPNTQAEQRIVASLAHEPSVIAKLSNSDVVPPPPPPSQPTSNQVPPPPPPASLHKEESSITERQRQPYSQSSFTSHTSTFDDDDFAAGPPSRPIERERKPYTSVGEGLGKKYDDVISDEERDIGGTSRPKTSQYRPEPSAAPPQNSRSSRATSSANNQGSYSTSASSEARNIPPPNRHRYSQGGHGPPPAMFNNPSNYSKSGSGRRSPPLTNPYVRSDPTELYDIPNSQYASNLYGHNSNSSSSRNEQFSDPGTQDDNSFYRRHGQEGRGYPIPGRNSQQAPPPLSGGYDLNYPAPGSYGGNGGNGTGGTAAAMPIPPSGSYEDRRRSMYAGPTPNLNPVNNYGNSMSGAGGTDGYGSFAPGSVPQQQQQGYGPPPTQQQQQQQPLQSGSMRF